MHTHGHREAGSRYVCRSHTLYRRPAHRATLIHPQQLRRTVGTCTHMATGK